MNESGKINDKVIDFFYWLVRSGLVEKEILSEHSVVRLVVVIDETIHLFGVLS